MSTLPSASHHSANGTPPAVLPTPPGTETRQVVALFRIVTLEEFVAVEEEGAGALVGTANEALIPEDGDVMLYGDGGAGKTTLAVDLGCHLAAGDPWLGIPVARQTRVLLVENEGPRPLFRAKLRRKREAWAGSPLGERILVWEHPWAGFTFEGEHDRQLLAEQIRALELDVVILGPVTRAGMNEAGTLQEVRDFMLLIGEVRRLAGRRVTFVLVHHENKGGQVSGAWEGAGDSLFHVQGQGHGRTRLFVQKARWASSHHATSLQLVWTDGEGFEVEDKPELDDDAIAEQILTFVRENSGTNWTRLEEATPGMARERRRKVRDGLLKADRLLNVIKENGAEIALDECPERRPSRLFLAGDPAVAHLRRASGADAAQTAPAGAASEQLHLRRAPRPLRGAGVGAAAAPPSDGGFDGLGAA